MTRTREKDDPEACNPQSLQQQPKEYIITMGRIIKARNMLMVDGYHNADVLDRMVNLLRARPHTSPPEPATIIGKQTHEAFEDAKFPVFVQGTGWISKHDAERMFAETAAKAAREQEQQRINAVIKELEHLRDGQYNDVVGHNVRYAYDYAIILLRAQQGGDP
jgi:hypothetical protein